MEHSRQEQQRGSAGSHRKSRPSETIWRRFLDQETSWQKLLVALAALIVAGGAVGSVALRLVDIVMDDPSVLHAYYSIDGSAPAATPPCEGIFSLCLDMPIDKALALLGPEESRYGRPDGGLTREWSVGDAHVSVTEDRVGAITSIAAAISRTDSGFRLSLPNGLLLGESSMADVMSAYGEPHRTDEYGAENYAYYEFLYWSGPEGSWELDFTYAAEVGTRDDPGGINSALLEKRVTSYVISYATG